MIACLTGKLLFSDPLAMTCVIDCAGVGYSLSVTSSTIGALPPADENGGAQVRLYTHLQVREDGVELFGFSQPGRASLLQAADYRFRRRTESRHGDFVAIFTRRACRPLAEEM